MLLDLFKHKKCFKLVCGAGNEDVKEVEKLVMLYSKAGANYFDLCAKPDVVDAAKKGLERAGIKEDRYLCVSIGDENDQHFCKANITQEACIKCGQCKNECLQNAIEYSNNEYAINPIRCIGCKKCIKVCPQNCITLSKKTINLKEVLPPLLSKGLDGIEFHIIGNEGEELLKKWNDIQELFSGPITISINREALGDNLLIELIKNLISKREPYTTIIQADGIPMSGGENNYHTTLQAVAISDVFQNSNLPVYIMASGGTNAKTTELAKMCGVELNGLAVGSYARKIVKEYTSRDDFFENESIFNEALKIAQNLVDISLKDMK